MAMITTEELHGKLRGLLSELASNLEQVTQDNLGDNGARPKLLTQAWDAVKAQLVTLDRIDRGLSTTIRFAEMAVWRYNSFLEMPAHLRASLLGAPTHQSLCVKFALTHARDELAAFLDVRG
jgi:hypothetical protein